MKAIFCWLCLIAKAHLPALRCYRRSLGLRERGFSPCQFGGARFLLNEGRERVFDILRRAQNDLPVGGERFGIAAFCSADLGIGGAEVEEPPAQP